MPISDTLREIAKHQKEILRNLETEIVKIEENDLVIENEKMKIEIEQYKTILEKEKSSNLRIYEENKNLKNALYEQLYNEKIKILDISNKKIDAYYKTNVEGEVNRLAKFEKVSKEKIDYIATMLRENRIEHEDEIYLEVEKLKDLLDKKITLAREKIARDAGAFSNNRSIEFEKLKSENVTEEEVKARVKQNNLESLVGLNILNKLGILLLIIGVIAASQFTYHKLPDSVKSIFIFIIGIVLLVTGEFLSRKKANIFSIGITSGGISVLYVAMSISYFGFKILDMYVALGLCILITVTAFILSQRYNSQTISVFALIGGYLPILSINGSLTLVYGAMIYFVILNVMALVISGNKKWIFTSFVGFALNVAGTVYIMNIIFSQRVSDGHFVIKGIVLMLYMVFAFMIYTLIPVVGTFSRKLSFKNSDIVLLALNTLISAVLLYTAFYQENLSDYVGLLALIFAVTYLILGKLIEILMAKEDKAMALFYLTGLTFVVLVIPFQFGKVWLSLGWLIEGVALLTYGIYKGQKNFVKAGSIISMLCLWAFLIFDVLWFSGYLFAYKYAAITIGSVIILVALVLNKRLSRFIALFFKYCTVVNVWIFIMYIIGDKVNAYLMEVIKPDKFNTGYIINALMIVVSFLIACVMPRIKVLCDRVMKILSMLIYCITLIALFFLNFNSPVTGSFDNIPIVLSIIGTFIILILGLISVIALRDLVLCQVLEGWIGIGWYPLIVSSYFVVILTQNLVLHYNLAFNNAVISIIYVVTALLGHTFL